MDYGQPMYCNCGNLSCPDYGRSTVAPEQPNQRLDEVIPEFMRHMFEGIGMEESMLRPVATTSQIQRDNMPALVRQALEEERGQIDIDEKLIKSLIGEEEYDRRMAALKQTYDSPWFQQAMNGNVYTTPRLQMDLFRQVARELAINPENMQYLPEDTLPVNKDAMAKASMVSPSRLAMSLAHQQQTRFIPVTEESLISKGERNMEQMQGFGNLLNTIGLLSESSRVLPGNTKPAVSKQVADVGSEVTRGQLLANFIVPDFNAQIVKAQEIEDLDKRLRTQNRLIQRLAKLSKYLRSPHLIDKHAIDCRHELAIFSWRQYNRVVEGQITEAEAVAQIHEAETAFRERVEQKQTHRAMQEQALARANAVDKVMRELGSFEALGENLNTEAMSKKLRELAAILESSQTTLAEDFVQGAKKTTIQENPSPRGSDNSNMGLDYRRQVPTTISGYSDDKFGGATRNGMTTDKPSNAILGQPMPLTGGKVVELSRELASALGKVPRTDIAVSPVFDQATTERDRKQIYVNSIIERLDCGEALNTSELLTAAQFAREFGTEMSLRLTNTLAKRMAGKTPFIQ